MSCELSPRAIALCVSHACAHPHARATCVGVFLGHARDDDGPSASGRRVSAMDAIPMFHGDVSTTPYAEIALEQIVTHAETRGMRVVAAYRTAGGGAEDGMFDALARASPAVFAGVVELTKEDLEAFAQSRGGGVEFKMYARESDGESASWTRRGGRAFASAETSAEARALVARTLGARASGDASSATGIETLRVYDFDDHFDALTMDWRNPSFPSSAE